MTDIAIRVENLSKLYRIGRRERYKTLRDTLADAVHAPFRRLRSKSQHSDAEPADGNNTIWALKDVSFEVKRGEVIGIIGRNGAGKTTLLKILSRITEPTTGRAEIHGRVGSLLEVGTGFHPELTGRENIYLNGAILGMKRAEIERKFDEIVAFAEIERFLDTPVKHYSSGMYVRLAFAVAAHLEPEILLVDEVLAVGDAAFQKKCLGKMGDVTREGRTVLFVSHNMGAVESLCQEVIYLVEGTIRSFSTARHSIAQYMGDVTQVASSSLLTRSDRSGTGKILVTGIRVYSCDQETSAPRSGSPACFEITYHVPSRERTSNVAVALGIDDMTNTRILTMWSKLVGQIFSEIPPSGRFLCRTRELNLRSGSYLVHVQVDVNGIVADYVHNACRFDVEYAPFYASKMEPTSSQGCVLMPHEWDIAP